MSFRAPTRPQPSRVYRRRRLVVLLGLLAVLAVIALIIFRPGPDPQPAAAPRTPSPAASSAATDVAPAESPDPDDGPPACTEDQVDLQAVTDKGEYGEKELPQLSWTLANTSSDPCTINVGTKAQIFTITSGSDTIWTSTDCQTDGSDTEFTLQPSGGAPVTSSPIAWDRTRSSGGTCDDDRPAVDAGGASYHFSVTVGGFPAAETAQFLLD